MANFILFTTLLFVLFLINSFLALDEFHATEDFNIRQKVADKGQDVFLHCYPEDESADFYWIKSNGTLPDRAVLSNHTLHIKNVQLEDEGTYKCFSRQYSILYDAEASEIELVVRKPLIQEVATLGLVYAPMVKVVSNQEIREGEDIRLTCSPHAKKSNNPVVWNRYHHPIPHRARYENDSKLLIIPQAQADDSGIYFCRYKKSVNPKEQSNITIDVKPRLVNESCLDIIKSGTRSPSTNGAGVFIGNNCRDVCEEATGTFSYPVSDCRAYVKCTDWEAEAWLCPNFEVFNPTTVQCETADDDTSEQCQRRTTTPPTTSQPLTEVTSTFSTTTESTSTTESTLTTSPEPETTAETTPVTTEAATTTTDATITTTTPSTTIATITTTAKRLLTIRPKFFPTTAMSTPSPTVATSSDSITTAQESVHYQVNDTDGTQEEVVEATTSKIYFATRSTRKPKFIYSRYNLPGTLFKLPLRKIKP